MLPKPSANFTLPSLYDNLELNARLYFPRLTSDSDGLWKGLAIFAHPYAPLGGSFDDPVVHSVGSLFVSEGYLLTTFNFRGAEGSSGKTSWTGKAELGDYAAVYAFALSFLGVEGVRQHLHHGKPSTARLLLGGYSYGSMITSYLPALHTVQSIIQHAPEGSAEFEINERADKLAKAFLGYCESHDRRGRYSTITDVLSPNATVGGYESPKAANKIRRESSRHSVDVERVRRSVDRVRHKLSRGGSDEVHQQPQILETYSDDVLVPETSFLIISPLFGAVSQFATMFSGLKFERQDREATAAKNNRPTDPQQVFCHSPTLVVFGTHDHFTSSKKTRNWCEDIKNRPESQLDFCEVREASHFWHDADVERQLVGVVQQWLHGLTT